MIPWQRAARMLTVAVAVTVSVAVFLTTHRRQPPLAPPSVPRVDPAAVVESSGASLVDAMLGGPGAPVPFELRGSAWIYADRDGLGSRRHGAERLLRSARRGELGRGRSRAIDRAQRPEEPVKTRIRLGMRKVRSALEAQHGSEDL